MFDRTLPVADPDTAPYWASCAKHQLRLQRCVGCTRLQHFPGPVCRSCGAKDLEWSEVSGRGFIYTFIVVHHVVAAGFPKDRPYVVAWVELDDQPGLRVLTNILECSPDDVSIGQRVEVTFEDLPGGVSLPQFRPA